MDKAGEPDIDPTELTRLSRAYVEQESLRRTILGKGPPKAVEAVNGKGKGKAKPDPAKFVEPA